MASFEIKTHAEMMIAVIGLATNEGR